MFSDLHDRKATHYFTLIDEDGNGLIEASDFALRAQRLASIQEVTAEGAREALREQVVGWWKHICTIADVDGDARVTLPEWRAYWHSVLRGVERGDGTLDSLHRAARGTLCALDRAGTGRVTLEETSSWPCRSFTSPTIRTRPATCSTAPSPNSRPVPGPRRSLSYES
jgi:hypothetical protein